MPRTRGHWASEGPGASWSRIECVGGELHLAAFREHVRVDGLAAPKIDNAETDGRRHVAERNAQDAEAEEAASTDRRGIVRVNHVTIAVGIEMIMAIEVSPQREQSQRRCDESRLWILELRAALIVQRHVVVAAGVCATASDAEQRRWRARWELNALEQEPELAVPMKSLRRRCERDFALERGAFREDQLMVGGKHGLGHDGADWRSLRRLRRIERGDESGVEDARRRGAGVRGRRRWVARAQNPAEPAARRGNRSPR